MTTDLDCDFLRILWGHVTEAGPVRDTNVMRVCALLFLSTLVCLAQSAELRIYMLEHAVGTERYELSRGADSLTLNTTLEFTDRANTRTTSATLLMKGDYTPVQLTLKDKPNSVEVKDGRATVQENGATRTLTPPERYFTIFGETPFALQAMMFHYWTTHGKPNRLPILRGSAAAEPVEIEHVGRDSISLNGKPTLLERYTVANLAFGREIVWIDSEGELAAAMTFAGGLPMEAVNKNYESAFSDLYRDGVAQEMKDLKALAVDVPPERTGSYAIAGATLVDGTGAKPVQDSVVLIQNGRIAAAGPRTSVKLPRGTRVVEAQGQTLLPGLWEMHIHASGVEFGPALLAAGITTARDCGGEFEYLVAQRNQEEQGDVPSPRMLLAGLVDAGGLKAFGNVTAETPEQGRAVVRRYHEAHFQQIKLYTYLAPDVVKAISAEAHSLGMTVTGHVPQALTTYEGIEAGMDQINHLNYVSRMMHPAKDPRGQIDFNSAEAEKAIAFLKTHGTVVDPTAGWGEMASHPSEVDVASFEPGILHAPVFLQAKFGAMGNSKTTAAQAKSRMDQNLKVISALYNAGITVVPGSDTGLQGYGLLRELELYVQAGLTPLQAIQSATIVSAHAMGLEHDSGTIERGKRADLILVRGNPLSDISDLRKVSKTVANGRMYDTAKLWKSVGFGPN